MQAQACPCWQHLPETPYDLRYRREKVEHVLCAISTSLKRKRRLTKEFEAAACLTLTSGQTLSNAGLNRLLINALAFASTHCDVFGVLVGGVLNSWPGARRDASLTVGR